ncbi:hypothetical protein BYT27DRAFT_7088568 [Phlegmacium glaucopus]|nr:hypothetical protein BYT27DRAFT_7088568 [Phlegmacium glaucopus]
MLHLLHNLTNVWMKEIWRVVTENWLLNPTGKANAFVEMDLVQEHLNFWIKARIPKCCDWINSLNTVEESV